MTGTDPPRPPLLDRLSLWLGPAALIALTALFSGWTEDRSRHAALDTLWLLLTAVPWAIAWIAAAIGYGRLLRSILVPDAEEAPAIQAGLGVALLLGLDAVAGNLGLLQVGGPIGGWILLLPGWLLLADQVRRYLNTEGGAATVNPPHWLNWTASPAIAVLLLACCSAPGWLWHSEFGGYDALSYHLQLPREWFAAGRIAGLEHNVYSFLPGYVEAAYYHLAVLTGGGIEFTYAAQFLHATLTVLTAVIVSRLALRLGGSRKRLIAAVAFSLTLTTPWVIVVGSLAYNEMAVALMLAAGLLALEDESITPVRGGICVGVFAATACAAKLTSLGFVALPLAILLCVHLRGHCPGRWIGALLLGGLAAFVCLLPYLLRNTLQTGNPVFPFASGLFGLGHWSAEQAATFRMGHLSDLPLTERAAEAFHQLLHFGIGPNPHATEPWHAQWSVLPWLAVAGLLVCALKAPLRAAAWRFGAILILQAAFWFFFTHVKSRFMLPAIVPGALISAISLRAVTDRLQDLPAKRLCAAALGIAALALSTVAVLIFRGEPYRPDESGRPLRAPAAMVGRAGLLSGDDLTKEQTAELAAALPAVYVNHVLPPDARVLLLGEAAVLYYRQNVAYQTTWDRGPMSLAMEASPDDPRLWISSLRDQGFTHLLVNDEMLERWQVAGWNDPNLTAARVHDAARQAARVEQSWPGLRMTLYVIDR